jgi:hypothetical protein
VLLGCGGENEKSVDEIRGCLQEEGLPVAVRPVPALKRTTLAIVFSARSRAFVHVYEDAGQAEEDREDIESTLRRLGGRIRVKDNVALEDRAVPPARLEAIEDCAL